MDTPTIYDVSRLSGVSTATVSRAFTAPDRVREETRRKVLAAAEALGYQPSAIARAMARQQTDKIAFLICKKDATILDEFYASICEGVMRRANSTSYQLLISTAADWQRTGQSKQIEGVILAGDAEPSLISSFQRQGVAVVLVNHRASGFELPSVVADEQNGARQVIDHLTAYGHRRIALLAGRFSSYITSVRYNAFLTAMQEHGIAVEAFSPMARGADLKAGNGTIARIAEAHEVSPAQVILRWHIENGTIIIPKSVHSERQRQNLDLFGFALTLDEHAAIDALDGPERAGHDPRTFSYA